MSTQTYIQDTSVIFDRILYSTADNSYNPSSGMFSCPTTGIYFVTVTAKSNGTALLQVDIKCGSTIVFRLNDILSNNPDTMISNNALVRCEEGENIQVVGAGNGDIFGDILIVTTLTVMVMDQDY